MESHSLSKIGKEESQREFSPLSGKSLNLQHPSMSVIHADGIVSVKTAAL